VKKECWIYFEEREQPNCTLVISARTFNTFGFFPHMKQCMLVVIMVTST